MNRDSHIVEIELSKIVPNRFQPRKVFNEDVSELAESIRQHGVLQPITVRPLGEKYEIIMGERRFRACEKLGMHKMPAMIVEMNDRESMEVALIENLQRQNLTPIEEALSYKRILDAGYVTQEQLAVKLGKTQSTIANKLRLLSLDKVVQNALLKGDISERHARSLLRLEDKGQQKIMLDRIISERLTVKRTDEEIKKMEKNNIQELTKPSIEIIDFDDNPFKTYENPEPQEKVMPKPSEPVFNNIPVTQIIDDFETIDNSLEIEDNHSYNNNYIEEKVVDKEFVENVSEIEETDNFEPTTKEVFEPTFDELVTSTETSNQKDLEAVKKIIKKCQSDIQALGYEVDFDDFDLEKIYQVILKIRKQ